MKSFIFCLLVICTLFVTSCYCKCECDANDNACISECVVEANDCVTSCKGNIECYEGCIDDKWPTGDASAALEDMNESAPVFRDVMATTTVYSTVSAATATLIPSTLTATVSASTTGKQTDVSSSHTSLGSILGSSATVQSLFVVISVAMIYMS